MISRPLMRVSQGPVVYSNTYYYSCSAYNTSFLLGTLVSRCKPCSGEDTATLVIEVPLTCMVSRDRQVIRCHREARASRESSRLGNRDCAHVSPYLQTRKPYFLPIRAYSTVRRKSASDALSTPPEARVVTQSPDRQVAGMLSALAFRSYANTSFPGEGFLGSDCGETLLSPVSLHF